MEQKISLPEIIIMGIICVGVDFAELIANLLSATVILAPLFIGLEWIANAFYCIALAIWLIIKRMRGTWLIAGGLLEFIPGINALPLRTITLATTVSLTNKASQIPGMDKALKMTQKIKK